MGELIIYNLKYLRLDFFLEIVSHNTKFQIQCTNLQIKYDTSCYKDQLDDHKGPMLS